MLLIDAENVQRSMFKLNREKNQSSSTSLGKTEKNGCLSNRRDHLQLNSNRRWQRTDLNRSASWIRFAGSGKIFGVDSVVDWKIFFHVREKHRDVDDVLPCRPRVFEN